MHRVMVGVLVSVLLTAPASACIIGNLNNTPGIVITSSPPDCCYGQIAGSIAGTVNNVNTDSTAVVLYAVTNQYYVQPSTQAPFTFIGCPGGTFSNVTYGGCRYWALLVKRSWNPPATLFEIPPIGGPILAVAASVNSIPVLPLTFAGRSWTVKTSCGIPVGPGSNPFSDSQDNVSVDGQGRLHLRITHRNGNWFCAEVLTDQYLGYGVYEFEVESPVDQLDPNVVFSGFSYSDQIPAAGGETDIELSRWGVPTGQNAQYVVQPFATCLRDRFNMHLIGVKSTHEFIWTPDSITFSSWQGGIDQPGTLIASYTYSNSGCIPPADEARMRFNLWLYDANGDGLGDPPTNGQEVEVIVSDFRFYDWPTAVADRGRPSSGPWLSPPVPNPASGTVTCIVQLTQGAPVRVDVFDSNGRSVDRLYDGNLDRGTHVVHWAPWDADGRRLPGGVYYIRLRAGLEESTRKVVLLNP